MATSRMRARYQRDKISSQTANYTLTNNDSGTTINNLGATAGITLTLPAARVNDVHRFFCAAAFPMVITAPSGVAIYADGLKRAGGSSFVLWQIGHHVTLTSDGTDWYASDVNVAEGADRYWLYDNFSLRPGINANRDVPAADTYNTAQMQLGVDRSPHFEIVGTNSTSATCTTKVGGGVTCTTTGGANDQSVITPHLNANVSGWTGTNWATDDSLYFKTRCKVGGSVATIIGWAGLKLTLTDVQATDADQAFFRFQNGVTSGDWVTGTAIGGVNTITDSAVAAAINTDYDLEIYIDSGRVARLFLNYVLVFTTAALTTGINLIPYLGVRGNAQVMHWRDIYMSKIRK